MKRLIYIFAILATLIGCSKEEVKRSGKITMSSSADVSIPGEGGTGSFSFQTDDNWSASSSETWCKVGVSSGQPGSVTLNVSADKNETGNERNSTITISTTSSSVKVYVKQSQIYVMDFAQSDFLLPSSGDTIAVSFSTNMSYEYKIPDEVTWIKPVVKSKGVENFTHHFLVEKNETYDNRSAKISFINKANRERKEISVVQLQKDAIIPADTKYEIGAQSQMFEFAISSNVDYEITTSQEWIRCVQENTKALNNKNIKFEVEENDTFAKRSAVVTIKSADIVQEVEIIQNTWPSKLVLTIVHSEKEFVSPSFTGRELGGTILWGDGTREEFSHDKSHKYDAAGETTTVYDLHGNNFYTFEIGTLNSIKSFSIVCSEEK